MFLLQYDYVSVDLGYVINSGMTFMQGVYNATYDDQFAIQVQIQMSDHPLTANNTNFNIYFSVQFDDVIAVSE